VVLNFWSTWCLPCKQEHGLLQQAQRDNPKIRFLGVLYSDKPDKARAYLNKVSAAYPTLVDENNRVSIDYGVAGVPETFFISGAGEVVAKWVGPLSWPALQAKLALLEEEA
jgi:cytochrome c biogenesis protein CcmG/thiol:disulfide interchange protein DsbE